MIDLAQPAEPAVDVILRDGTTLRLRPPTEADVHGVMAFFADLSVRSRFLRFHGFTVAGDRFVRSFVEPDWAERGSLIGVMGDAADERVVGVGNYVRLRDPQSAEAAFAVADEFQGKGIGTRMLEQLAQRAAAHGIGAFIAEVLPENNTMLSVFSNAGFVPTRTLEGGVIEVRFPIEATEGYRARVDERDHVAVTASLRPFFEPRTVAVIGASARRGSIGGELFRNVLAGGFTGAAYPVNRSGAPVAGVRAYRSLEEIGDQIDLCVISLPGDLVLAAAEEALRSGTRSLCVISAGFAETGPEGVARQEQLLTLVRAHGARLVGPNCLGIATAAVGLNATFAPRAFPPGRIGFSSQSGALGLALLERAEARGLGLSAFVSIGNKADVSSNDLLEWWEDDPGTDLVLLYVESFGNPRKFARIARRLAREKPVLAMKSGRSRAGQKAAGSHTAALAGSDTAVDAVFRQAGVIRADTLGGLLDVAALLSSQPVPRGRRVAVLTNAGGLGILCADACELAGLELPQLDEQTRNALAARAAPRGVDGEPRRHARFGDCRQLPCRAAEGARRPRHRRRDRAVRAARRGRCRGCGCGDQPGDRRRESARQAGPGRDPRCERRARDAALRGSDPVVRLSRGGSGRPRPGGRLRRVAAPLGRHRAPARRCRHRDRGAGLSPRRSRTTQRHGSTRPRRGGCCLPMGCRSSMSASPPRRRRRQAPPPSSVTPSSSRRRRAGAHKTESAASCSISPTRRPCG